MRILVLSNLYPPHVLGGYEILCGQTCAAYVRRGHDVVVLTTNHGVGGEASGAPEVIDGCTVHRILELYLPFDRPATLSRGRRLKASRHNERATAAFLRTWRPDVVHVWSQLRLTLGSARACRAAGLPMVFSFNDEHIAGYLPSRFGASPGALARWLVDNVVLGQLTLAGLPVDTATVISEVTKRNLIARGVNPPRFPVIYQGIPLGEFPPKDEIGSLHNPLRVLFVGQVLRYKGVHTVVEAAHSLASQGRAVSLTVAGAGDPGYERELAELAAQGRAQVRFAGRVGRADIAALYRAHDVFVFASTWEEPFGLTHLEAMASGLPVISTLCGGQSEFLADGENCLAFAPSDAGALAACLTRLVDDPATAVRLAGAGRETATTRFSLERYADELLALLGEAQQ